MGGGGTVLREIHRYYQISLLSSENHGNVGGEAWNLIGSLRKVLYKFSKFQQVSGSEPLADIRGNIAC